MRYPHLTLFIVSILLAIGLYGAGIFERIFSGLGGFGLIGAAISGLMYPFSFTSALATVSFIKLGGSYQPILLAVIGGGGAVFGDILIFDFVGKGLLNEFHSIKTSLIRWPMFHFLSSLPQHRWFLPLGIALGVIAIVSPLPNEIGVAILAFYHLQFRKFIPLTLVLNGLGIYLISSLGYLS